MLAAISEHTGLSFASVIFVLAVGQLCFGITQPFSGFAAARYGNRPILLAGAVGAIAGAALLPFCKTAWTVMVALGVLLPGNLGVVSYGLLTSAVSPHVPDGSRSLASDIVNASSGIGNTLFAPVISTAIAAGSLANGMTVLTAFAAATIPFTLLLCRNTNAVQTSVISGALTSRVPMQKLLGTLYGLRPVGILAYLLLPKTMGVICGYIILLGLTGAATVTPVFGLCRRLFGKSGVTIFYGIVFLVHQIGSFFAA